MMKSAPLAVIEFSLHLLFGRLHGAVRERHGASSAWWEGVVGSHRRHRRARHPGGLAARSPAALPPQAERQAEQHTHCLLLHHAHGQLWVRRSRYRNYTKTHNYSTQTLSYHTKHFFLDLTLFVYGKHECFKSNLVIIIKVICIKYCIYKTIYIHCRTYCNVLMYYCNVLAELKTEPTAYHLHITNSL